MANEVCADCKEPILFNPMAKRVRYECVGCERPLCAKHGILERDGVKHRLPCRRCKSLSALEGGKTP